MAQAKSGMCDERHKTESKRKRSDECLERSKCYLRVWKRIQESTVFSYSHDIWLFHLRRCRPKTPSLHHSGQQSATDLSSSSLLPPAPLSPSTQLVPAQPPPPRHRYTTSALLSGPRLCLVPPSASFVLCAMWFHFHGSGLPLVIRPCSCHLYRLFCKKKLSWLHALDSAETCIVQTCSCACGARPLADFSSASLPPLRYGATTDDLLASGCTAASIRVIVWSRRFRMRDISLGALVGTTDKYTYIYIYY
jgi:hypothetical protein